MYELDLIAAEIEKVIDALASPRERSNYGKQRLRTSLSRGEQSFRRAELLKKLDPFYLAIEQAAATIADFSQKQQFLNKDAWTSNVERRNTAPFISR